VDKCGRKNAQDVVLVISLRPSMSIRRNHCLPAVRLLVLSPRNCWWSCASRVLERQRDRYQQLERCSGAFCLQAGDAFGEEERCSEFSGPTASVADLSQIVAAGMSSAAIVRGSSETCTQLHRILRCSQHGGRCGEEKMRRNDGHCCCVWEAYVSHFGYANTNLSSLIILYRAVLDSPVQHLHLLRCTGLSSTTLVVALFLNVYVKPPGSPGLTFSLATLSNLTRPCPFIMLDTTITPHLAS